MSTITFRRPATNWFLHSMVNLRMFVYPMEHNIMSNVARLPKYLLLSKGIQTLLKDKDGNSYDNPDCFFRCLAMHNNGSKSHYIRKDVRKLNERFQSLYKTNPNWDGQMKIDWMTTLEGIFKVWINIYHLENSQSVFVLSQAEHLEVQPPPLRDDHDALLIGSEPL